jgi:chemotaxis methyl-accepting protein methylase
VNGNSAAAHQNRQLRGEASLPQLVSLMQRAYDRDLAGYEETFLARSLERRLAATSLDAAAYLARLEQDGVEAETLVRSLNVGYSEFFRNPLTFALLEQVVLPGFADQQAASVRAAIRVWSAGCAAGQEPYSIAILLADLAASRVEPLPFRIIATDVCEAELASARRGMYNQRSVQNVRLRHLNEYFSRHGEHYAIVPRLREWVDFSIYDLRDERSNGPPTGIYGDFDLVICCNLLLYYRPQTRRIILSKLRRCLSPRGLLVTGESERAIIENEGGFRALFSPAAIFRLASRGR